jgi:hypothetical protein
MSSLCTSALSSLDLSLGVLRESWEQLRAAKSVDIAQVIGQLTRATEYARVVRESVWSELPVASWQDREQLDIHIAEIQKLLDARALEQLRFRLLAQGTIAHRRAHRLNELNQLREQAINELRSQVALDGAPPALPGPQADQWIAWACGLQEADDAEPLQALRNGFPHLDEFVANLEPHLWIAKGPAALDVLPKPERAAEDVQPERPLLEAKSDNESVVRSGAMPIGLEDAGFSGGRDELRVPVPRDELRSQGLESNTLTPHDVTPPRTDEDNLRILEQERALLAGMMGLVSDPVNHFDPAVDRFFNAAFLREGDSGVAPTTPSSSPSRRGSPAERSPQEGPSQ